MDLVHINLYGVAIYGADSSFTFINKIVSHIKLTAKELHSIKHIIFVTHNKDALGISKDVLGTVWSSSNNWARKRGTGWQYGYATMTLQIDKVALQIDKL